MFASPHPLEAEVWAALGGDPSRSEEPAVTGRRPWLGGPLAVDALAVAAAGAALRAAAELAEARGLGRPAIRLSAEHVAASFRSERHLRRDGRPFPAGFAPLSRFVRCADGWARTHGNYDHHAEALARALDLARGGGEAVEALERAARALDAEALEERVNAAGGCAAAVRTEAAWRAHPAGAAVAGEPLVAWRAGGPPARRLTASAQRSRPAEGIRVLDLTRVIAGPVAGRTLAALGAEVLRVDPPGRPELLAQHLDTGAGKRSAVLDLREEGVRERLLAAADAVLLGYRPGALRRFGLEPGDLAARHPHLVAIELSAWGFDGPWARRRGFDSLVQAASGIAARLAVEDRPGALPAQALDHATGHMMAAAALQGLARRARGEPVAGARLSLARTAHTLLAASGGDAVGDGAGRVDRFRVAFGPLSLIAPPGALDGVALRWAHGPRAPGGDRPEFARRRLPC